MLAHVFISCVVTRWFIFVLANNSSFDVYDIPQEIYEACPYADICNQRATQLVPEGFLSCCQSCSCEEECGLTLDCCFNHLDKYRLIEKGEIACIKPVFGASSRDISYYMVQSCKVPNQTTQLVNESKCRLHDENGTHLVAPVSSRNGVYINAICAECNHIYDYEKWDVVYYSRKRSFLSSFRSKLELSYIDGFGTIEYMPPNSAKFPRPKVCHTVDTMPDCSDDDLLYPLTCDSLKATFLSYDQVYKNVACKMCNRSKSAESTSCKPFKGKDVPSQLTVLLDSDVIGAHREQEASTAKICKSGSVKSKKTERCLPILCPTGLLRTENGCKYLITRWYVSYIAMQIKLFPVDTSSLPVTMLKSMSDEERSNPSLWVKPSCCCIHPADVFYENSSLTNVKSFIVRLFKQVDSTGFSSAYLFPLINRCVGKSWTVIVGDVSYQFSAVFDKYFGYIQDGRRKMVHETVMRPKLYDTIVFSLKDLMIHKLNEFLYIKKTFFCNQFQLPDDEVEAKGYGEIRITSINKTLGNNEFNKETVHGSSASIYSMCVEDYHLNTAGAPSWSCIKSWFATYFTVVFVLYCYGHRVIVIL